MARARLPGWVTTAGGLLAVAAALALSGPGVQVARAGQGAADPGEFERFLAHAGEPAPRQTADPATCGATHTERAGADAAALLAAVKRQVAAQAAREGHEGDVEIIVLNNRGYNYGAPADPRIERQLIERELGR